MGTGFFKTAHNKNYLELYRLFLVHYEFIFPIIVELRKKFGIATDLETIDPANDPKEFDKCLAFAKETLGTFLKRNKDHLPYIFKEFGNIRRQVCLGREWNTTLLRFMVSGICLPPPYSLFFYEEGDSILIEINKHTTKRDIDFAWEHEIKQLRREKYGKTRAAFPSKKQWEILEEYRRANDAIRTKNPNDSEDVSYKKSDRYIIAELYANAEDITKETDRKRTNTLRVRRHRMKKLHNSPS